METATLLTVAFKCSIPCGALLWGSYQPMISSGVKTRESDNSVTKNFVKDHLNIGIKTLQEIINNCKSVKHLRFDEE
jgi:AMP nucleosidase